MLNHRRDGVYVLLFFLRCEDGRTYCFHAILIHLLKARGGLTRGIRLYVTVRVVVRRGDVRLCLVRAVLPFFLMVEDRKGRHQHVTQFFLRCFLVDFMYFFFLAIIRVSVSRGNGVARIV